MPNRVSPSGFVYGIEIAFLGRSKRLVVMPDGRPRITQTGLDAARALLFPTAGFVPGEVWADRLF